MKVSFFETGRYQTPVPLPAEWPAAPANYSPEAGGKAYQAMIERLEYVESIGFDWASLSEHHYSPRILTPSPIVCRGQGQEPQNRAPLGRSCRRRTRSASSRNW
jgi:hypothetical protein